jgi:cytochrome c-type biogenesis protein CcmE
MVATVVLASVLILAWSLSPPESENVRELVDNPKDFLGKDIQIKGIVENNTIVNGTNAITFNLSDEKDLEYNVTVHYEGSAPNNFQGGKTVFIKGVLEKDDDDGLLFKADKIVIGCPSKYD